MSKWPYRKLSAGTREVKCQKNVQACSDSTNPIFFRRYDTIRSSAVCISASEATYFRQSHAPHVRKTRPLTRGHHRISHDTASTRPCLLDFVDTGEI